MSVIANDKQIVKIDNFDINVLQQALDGYAIDMWESYQEYLKKGKERKSRRLHFCRTLRRPLGVVRRARVGLGNELRRVHGARNLVFNGNGKAQRAIR